MMGNSTPSVKDTKAKNFTSYRRLWLDSCLQKYSPGMRGIVIDLGGKRENKRGTFNPPEEQASAWWYFNLELSTHPNTVADVTAVPIKSASANVVICTEVLEHLEDPVACVQEIHRILCVGGHVYASVPFIYPIHADPYDFQRLTADGIRRYFRDFSAITIIPMGGYLGTIGMLLEIGIPGISGMGLHKKIIRRTLTWLARMLYKRDLLAQEQNSVWQKFTTGYFLEAIK